jgi:class 3 adenylate cyclase
VAGRFARVEPLRTAAVPFTDIVASTELARRVVQEFQGQLVKTTGDGILATFDSPGRGIRCGRAPRRAGWDRPDGRGRAG